MKKNVKKVSALVTKKDIQMLSKKIDKNQSALNQLDDISKKIDRNTKALNQLDDVSKKIDRNQKALDQIDDVSNKMDSTLKILQENEQTLKDLGGLKRQLNLLDTLFIKIDKIAGDAQTYREQQELNSNKFSNHDDRHEKIEKHIKLPISA